MIQLVNNAGAIRFILNSQQHVIEHIDEKMQKEFEADAYIQTHAYDEGHNPQTDYQEAYIHAKKWGLLRRLKQVILGEDEEI